MDIQEFLAPLTASELGFGTILSRMLWAIGLGAVIGIDREYLNRPAGLRTNVLVSLAAATFTVLTLELMRHADLQSAGETTSDPLRIIEAVTAGVAFLAAGSIIMSGGKVHGLTTGAGLWLAGAVGTACGIGAYSIAILATVLGFLVLVLLGTVANAIPKKPGTEPDAEDDEQSAKK
jgi:putative Mg2+ transporter-C (MgtC) family protein